MSAETTVPAVAIGVPVRNELERLPHLFSALSNQCRVPTFTLCLLFDNCVDGSIELAARVESNLPFKLVMGFRWGDPEPNAGKARSQAMALAVGEAAEGIILTTDADSAPDPDWVAASCRALTQSDIVAGRITRSAGRSHDSQHRVSSYFDRLHMLRRRLDPVPWDDECTHHWTSGASLGFRTPVYRALGGFPELPSGEDAAIVDAAMRSGYRVRRDARVRVRTSSRRQGRALGGFASALARQDTGLRMSEFVHPDDEAWRFSMQAEARARYERGDVSPLARALGVDEADVRHTMAAAANGEAFAARIVGAPPNGLRFVSLSRAEALLSAREASFLAGAA